MGISKHNKTGRGTQKQRARVHDQYLADKFPHIFGHIGTQKQRARVHDQYLADKFPHIFGHIGQTKPTGELEIVPDAVSEVIQDVAPEV